MTRINCGISPIELTDQHLLAEIRELPRPVSRIVKNNGLVNLKNIPSEFKLGTGHESFFYDKVEYLHNRYLALLDEYKNRFNKEFDGDKKPYALANFKAVKDSCSKLYNNYTETTKDRKKLIERITERITESSQKPRWYRETILKEDAINLFN